MKSAELRQKFLDFFEKNGHKIVPSSSLLPTDPSVLFTTAGMQQFKPYYLGEESPWGKNVASCQKCIRTSDIEEVGDERHLTFFEMLGNFSFGGYPKEQAIKLAHEFITKSLGLEIDYVTVFDPDKVPGGDWRKGVFADVESYEVWKKLVPEEKIKKEGVDNFWGPTGEEGPCGPTTEIYVNGIEIWNIVFNEYFVPMLSHAMGESESYADFQGRLNKERLIGMRKLKNPGIDTGMGLERMVTVFNDYRNVYDTDLFLPIISKILSLAGIAHEVDNIPLSIYPKGEIGSNLTQEESIISVRVIADHIRAVVFLISDGVIPGNKDQGYVLRRLIRRMIARGKRIGISKIGSENFLPELAKLVIDQNKHDYPELILNQERITEELYKEEAKFRETLLVGIKKMEEYVSIKENSLESAGRNRPDFGSRNEDFVGKISGKDAFDLYQTYGFPAELLNEELSRYGMSYHEGEFEEELKKHQELSRTASAGMFKGGLADHDPKTIKLHTAHHLLLAALQEMFGKQVKQRGSNINQERLRIDFSFDRKLTDEEKKKLEDMVNEKIQQGLDVVKREMPLEEAQKIGAEMEFGVKYGNTVSVYFIEDKKGNAVSKEFCGGPHVSNTSELGIFKILKEEASSQGVRRIKATLQ